MRTDFSGILEHPVGHVAKEVADGQALLDSCYFKTLGTPALARKVAALVAQVYYFVAQVAHVTRNANAAVEAKTTVVPCLKVNAHVEHSAYVGRGGIVSYVVGKHWTRFHVIGCPVVQIDVGVQVLAPANVRAKVGLADALPTQVWVGNLAGRGSVLHELVVAKTVVASARNRRGILQGTGGVVAAHSIAQSKFEPRYQVRGPPGFLVEVPAR